jgi:oligoendopeptidase F
MQKKYLEHQDKLDELMDEFAANDDGDIELRDVQTYLTDALKVLQVELESLNRTQNFVLSTFLKDFTDFFKTTKKLAGLSAVVNPDDIHPVFNLYLQKHGDRVTVVDLISPLDKQLAAAQKQDQSKQP